jgi:hypothetical protein
VVCASLAMPFDSDLDFEDVSDTETIYSCNPDNWNDNHNLYDFCHCIPQDIYDYNINDEGTRFLRDNSTLVVIVVTDEGDYTPNMGTNAWPWDVSDCEIGEPWPVDVQEQCEDRPDVLCVEECKIDKFIKFFNGLDRRVVFAVIGPEAYIQTDQSGHTSIEVWCNDQNSTQAMIESYVWAAELTGGLYAPINVRNDDGVCEDANFDEVLADLGRLVSNLASGWHLSSLPALDTVLIFVDGEEVPPAMCLADDEDCVPSEYFPTCTGEPEPGLNGWTYDEASQSIKFHGDCIPDYNQVVDIYYLPESGGGRPLPF